MTYNERTVNLKVTRAEVCDILRAMTSLAVNFDMEASDPATTEDRRKICASSAKFWRERRDKIETQLDDFDKKNGL